MDQPGQGPVFGGQTLMGQFENDPTTLNTVNWRRFYQSIGVTRSRMGSLPFRVQQFYDARLGFVQNRQVSHYVAAAGILAHYIGDAAQPLHASHLHHGSGPNESGVHSQYETSMMNKFRRQVVTGVNDSLDGLEISQSFTGSQRAVEVTVELMQYAASVMSPQRIIDAYLAARQTPNTNDALWAELGDETIDVISQSALYLAEIWESAWLEGGGENIGWVHIVEIPHSTLRSRYRAKSFVRSNYLEDM